MGLPFVKGLRNWPAIHSSELGRRALLRADAMEGILRSETRVIGSERRMAEGVGNAPTSAMPILFSGQVQPACICLPSVKWSGWRDSHSRPPGSEPGRLLLTLHPENGCQGWTRTNTVRLNRPPCYFHTTWQLLFIVRGRRTINNITWRCRQELHLSRFV